MYYIQYIYKAILILEAILMYYEFKMYTYTSRVY